MAIEELGQRLKEEEVSRAKRYPLLDIQNDREEIRKISEDSLSYAGELYPEWKDVDMWEIVPRVVMEFIKSTFNVLVTKRKKDVTLTSIKIGEFLECGIEFGLTANADKDGSFNPVITLLSELIYDNEQTKNNELSKEIPVFGDAESDIEFICKNANNTLLSHYGIKLEDWRFIIHIVVSFLRITKNYLIEHRDDTDYGVTINLGNVVDLSIEKYGEDNNTQYCIQFGPGQVLKISSKDDETSESTGQGGK